MARERAEQCSPGHFGWFASAPARAGSREDGGGSRVHRGLTVRGRGSGLKLHRPALDLSVGWLVPARKGHRLASAGASLRLLGQHLALDAFPRTSPTAKTPGRFVSKRREGPHASVGQRKDQPDRLSQLKRSSAKAWSARLLMSSSSFSSILPSCSSPDVAPGRRRRGGSPAPWPRSPRRAGAPTSPPATARRPSRRGRS